MLGILTFVAWCAALPPAFLLIVLLAELLAGTFASRRDAAIAPALLPKIAILMPAHNEAASIARSIVPLTPQLGERVRLVAIADNCSDDTASVARAAGATVIERHDAALRGKGACSGLRSRRLAQDPPDVVVVLDADCELEGESLNTLAETCVASGRPVQSCYLLRSRPDDAAMVQISNFAFLIKNLVRQRGAARIGAAATLGGTGMAFPWTLFRGCAVGDEPSRGGPGAGHRLRARGHAPLYLETARTWSSPAAKDGPGLQRTRWEHGYVQTAANVALPLVGEGCDAQALETDLVGACLAVPPLALLMTLRIALLGATAFLALLGCFVAAGFSAVRGNGADDDRHSGIAWAREGRIAVAAPRCCASRSTSSGNCRSI